MKNNTSNSDTANNFSNSVTSPNEQQTGGLGLCSLNVKTNQNSYGTYNAFDGYSLFNDGNCLEFGDSAFRKNWNGDSDAENSYAFGIDGITNNIGLQDKFGAGDFGEPSENSHFAFEAFRLPTLQQSNNNASTGGGSSKPHNSGYHLGHSDTERPEPLSIKLDPLFLFGEQIGSIKKEPPGLHFSDIGSIKKEPEKGFDQPGEDKVGPIQPSSSSAEIVSTTMSAVSAALMNGNHPFPRKLTDLKGIFDLPEHPNRDRDRSERAHKDRSRVGASSGTFRGRVEEMEPSKYLTTLRQDELSNRKGYPGAKSGCTSHSSRPIKVDNSGLEYRGTGIYPRRATSSHGSRSPMDQRKDIDRRQLGANPPKLEPNPRMVVKVEDQHRQERHYGTPKSQKGTSQRSQIKPEPPVEQLIKLEQLLRSSPMSPKLGSASTKGPSTQSATSPTEKTTKLKQPKLEPHQELVAGPLLDLDELQQVRSINARPPGATSLISGLQPVKIESSNSYQHPSTTTKLKLEPGQLSQTKPATTTTRQAVGHLRNQTSIRLLQSSPTDQPNPYLSKFEQNGHSNPHKIGHQTQIINQQQSEVQLTPIAGTRLEHLLNVYIGSLLTVGVYYNELGRLGSLPRLEDQVRVMILKEKLEKIQQYCRFFALTVVMRLKAVPVAKSIGIGKSASPGHALVGEGSDRAENSKEALIEATHTISVRSVQLGQGVNIPSHGTCTKIQQLIEEFHPRQEKKNTKIDGRTRDYHDRDENSKSTARGERSNSVRGYYQPQIQISQVDLHTSPQGLITVKREPAIPIGDSRASDLNYNMLGKRELGYGPGHLRSPSHRDSYSGTPNYRHYRAEQHPHRSPDAHSTFYSDANFPLPLGKHDSYPEAQHLASHLFASGLSSTLAVDQSSNLSGPSAPSLLNMHSVSNLSHRLYISQSSFGFDKNRGWTKRWTKTTT